MGHGPKPSQAEKNKSREKIGGVTRGKVVYHAGEFSRSRRDAITEKRGTKTSNISLGQSKQAGGKRKTIKRRNVGRLAVTIGNQGN